MPSEFPPQPSRRATVALAVVAVVTFLYSFLIAAELLLWFALVGFAIGLYLTYLLIVVLFRLVEAVERIATAAEVESGVRDVTDVARPEDRVVSDWAGNGADDPADVDVTDDPAGDGAETSDDAAPESGDDPNRG